GERGSPCRRPRSCSIGSPGKPLSRIRDVEDANVVKDRSRRPEGGEWEPIKISSKFKSSAYVPKSPKPSSVLTKVWSSYRKANPTQRASNQRTKTRSESEAKSENFRTDLPGPV